MPPATRVRHTIAGMPIPPFVADLRRLVGTTLLWLPGCTAVVLRDGTEGNAGPEVLLARRSDNGWWSPVTGIVDPGENPHEAAVREVLEETGVVARVDRLVWVKAGEVVTHVNGDLGQYLDHTFRCTYVSGQAHPADEENTEVGWFRLDQLPDLMPRHRERIAAALAPAGEVRLG